MAKQPKLQQWYLVTLTRTEEMKLTVPGDYEAMARRHVESLIKSNHDYEFTGYTIKEIRNRDE